MAKILTDAEMKDIIRRAVDDSEIDCSDAYTHFLEDLAELITTHFGGTHGEPTYNESFMEEDGTMGGAYTTAFHVNECVPADGGIFARYDTDVKWEDGKEIEPERCDCGKLKKSFVHNCNGSSNMPEIFGCPKCDDTCGFCKRE